MAKRIAWAVLALALALMAVAGVGAVFTSPTVLDVALNVFIAAAFAAGALASARKLQPR